MKKKAFFLKTKEEIELIRQSGVLLGKTHAEVAKYINPGVSTEFLNKIAEEYIQDYGAWPSFKNYNGFPAGLCVSVNEKVVHGIPNSYELKDGDIVSVDCGVFLNEFHSDSAYTYPVGEVDPKVLELLRVTKESLYLGIEAVDIGSRVGDIGFAIQQHVSKSGYSIVRELVGHGVGKYLHEEPEVPNYGKKGQGVKLQEGMVFAIEPMINLGTRNVVQERDNWTIRTADRKPSAHFEHTVAVNNGKADILTTFEFIEEVLKHKHGKTVIN
ncbi:type I methionyl aminopeptidase [Xanthocytophaga agilis]|uniref:Methionine aminopeptidase n=1 Tax=Xanthocytophaga agilis TaxID=3048010 RepID=A0AAE3UFT0_9BACT|nr:type I methionyl aminopeptidase [Xanthocytophaga agilis]MDJ1500913.1 type I methionyl aminopeptidase [Xanthocytophaga agilis]